MPVALVQISGRLIRDQDRRAAAQAHGQRDALLFATGKLQPGSASRAIRQRDSGELTLRAFERIGNASKLERYRHVLQRGHRRDKMERTGKRCQHCGRENAPVRPRRRWPMSAPATLIEPLSARSSPAITISNDDFPRTRRADQADSLALGDGQPYIREDVNTGRPAAKREVYPGERGVRVVGPPGWSACGRCHSCGMSIRSFRPALCRHYGNWGHGRPDGAQIYRSPACFCRSHFGWSYGCHSTGAPCENCCVR